MSDRRRERFVEAMPKVELHVHLEGSIRPATLLRLARRHRIELPAATEEELRQWFRVRDFEAFVEMYLSCSRCLRDPEDFQLVAREFLEDQARRNVVHSEVHFTISTHLANGADGRELGQALGEVVAEAPERHGSRMLLIPDIVRWIGAGRRETYRRADATLEWALEHRGSVAALGLSGVEHYPVEPFRDHFETAAGEGLRRVAHAGEHGDARTVGEALDLCGAERIGHGIRAVEDPSLMARLAAEQVPLEVCPTSNLRLGSAADLETHPLIELRRAGIPLSINSDDPAIFETSISRELVAVGAALDLDPEELAGLSMAALRHSFLDETEKERLEEDFGRRFAALGEEIFDRPVVAAPALAEAKR